MAIYVRGDTHGANIQAFSYAENPELRHLTEDDVLIILGDTAIGWPGFDDTTRYALDRVDEKIADKGFSVIYLFGNHDNYDYSSELIGTSTSFNTLMKQVTFQGKTYKNQYVCDGSCVADICGKHCLLIAGADSHDIDYLFFPKQVHEMKRAKMTGILSRTIGVSWWPEEAVNISALTYMMAEHWDEHFDYVFTHDCVGEYVDNMNRSRGYGLTKTKSEKFFDAMSGVLDFDHWYHGHMHDDYHCYGNHDQFTCLYHVWFDAATNRPMYENYIEND